MKKLTAAEQQALRARAHALNPVVMVRDNGLSDAVLREIDLSLTAHELIKIRVFSDERDQRAAIMEEICVKLAALPIQQIGKILVVYRENPDAVPAPAVPRKSRAAPVASNTARRRKAQRS